MMKRLWLMFSVLLMFIAVPLTIAQDASGASVPVETGAVITWPYPVSEIWDVVPIVGTANVPNMAYYYIEAAALNEDMAIPTNAPWIPLTPGITEPVVNDTLATINTTDAADGLYAIRLTINTVDGQQYTDVVSPVRLHNERYQSEVDYIRSQIEKGVDPIQPPVEPPTGSADLTPRVVSNPGLRAVNVRRCDIADNDRCPINGFLREGEEGLVQAMSANGTGWFHIVLPAGNSGWVSPTVVTSLGNFNNVPVVAPPPPLNPPPIVVAPPPNPIIRSGLSINGLAIEGNRAVCNETFNVHINMANIGTAISDAGTLTLQDVHVNTGNVTYTGSGNYPALTPGANWVVVIPVKTSLWYNDQHELRAFTNGQQLNHRYTLEQGNCNRSTNPPPTPKPPAPQPPVVTFSPGECTVNGQPNAPLYDRPNGSQTGQVGPEGATFNVVKGTRINGQTWYELEGEMEVPGGWIRNSDASYNQDVCQI